MRGLIAVSRQSKIESHPSRANICRCDRKPKVSIQPASSRHRSPTRSQTVHRRGLSPIAVSRQSKIGRIDRPRQRVCASILVTGYPRSQNCIAPSLPHTLADCAWQPAQSHRRFSTVENRSHRPPAPTCAPARILVTACPRKTTSLHRRTATRRHSQGLCEAAGTLPPLFSTVENRSWCSIAHALEPLPIHGSSRKAVQAEEQQLCARLALAPRPGCEICPRYPKPKPINVRNKLP